jgi:DNA-directed RNA polymerase specialized sigma24 family protein
MEDTSINEHIMAFLLRYREKAEAELAEVTSKIRAVNTMIDMIEREHTQKSSVGPVMPLEAFASPDSVTFAEPRPVVDVPEALARQPKSRKKRKRRSYPINKRTLEALQDAGEKGLSADEVNAMHKVPLGTASSRLSILRIKGFARLDRKLHRYFIIPGETPPAPRMEGQLDV